MNRTRSLWESRVVTDLAHGLNVLVVAHGNSLRGLVKLIDNISDEDIEQVTPQAAQLSRAEDQACSSALTETALVCAFCVPFACAAVGLGGHPDGHSPRLQV